MSASSLARSPWFAACLAVAFDALFVVGWWTLVYTPTEDIVAVDKLGDVTLGGDTVVRLDRLAPDGRYALAETRNGIALFDTREVVGESRALDASVVGEGRVDGEIFAGVWLPGHDAAGLITEDGRVWRWPRGGTPSESGRVELPAWLDADGDAHHDAALRNPYRYVHHFLARSQGADAIEVVSRATGEVLYTHKHGKSMTLLGNRGDPLTAPYTSTATSARMELICSATGHDCERQKLPVVFSYGSRAFARSPGRTRAASCVVRRVRLGEIGEGDLGLHLGFAALGDCVDLSWLDEQRLWVSTVGRVQLVRVRKDLPRPLAGWYE